MLRDSSPVDGWELVAETDGVARLMGSLDALDADATYSRADIANEADVPVKTLYLDGALDVCVELGMFDRVEDAPDDETRYRVDPTSDVYRAATAFEHVARDARETQ